MPHDLSRRPPVQQKPSHAAPARVDAVAQLKSSLRGGDFASQEARLAPEGGGQSLPKNVQAKMERAFGTDFSGVRVHQDGNAEALGAHAYAQGENLQFARGQFDPESERGQAMIGHELAHVVQQREGRVAATMQAKGGLGVNTDHGLEREADVLGERAAKGEQVRSGGGASGAAKGGVVQGLFKVPQAQTATSLGTAYGKDVRVADDGSMAALEGEDQKFFYATKDHIKASNKVLAQNRSTFQLEAVGGADYTTRDLKNKSHSLHMVVGKDVKTGDRGNDLTGGPNCNEMAKSVMGSGKVGKKKEAIRQVKGTQGMTISESDSTGLDLMRHTTNIANGQSRKESEKGVKRFNKARALKPQKRKKDTTHFIEVKWKSDVDTAQARIPSVLGRWFGEHKGSGRFNIAGDHAMAEVRQNMVGEFEQQLRLLDTAMANGRPEILDTVTDTGNTSQMEFELDNTDNENEDHDAIEEFDQLNPVDRQKALEKAQLNEFASPEIGEAFCIVAVTDPTTGETSPFPYHWGGVIAKSGGDTATLENYAGRQAEDVYFALYGSQTKVTLDQRGVRKDQGGTTENEKKSTTFHGQWEQTFPGVHTLTHATKMTEKK